MHFKLLFMLINLLSKINISFSLFLLVAVSYQAAAFPEPTNPPRLVNDFARILNPSEVNRLERQLENYALTTSSQITIVTLEDLGGSDIVSYADQLAERWGVGQAGKENGIMILVHTAARQVRISVGYGLEGVIPDAVAKRIIENEILPAFRSNDFAGGLQKASHTLMQLASGEFSAEQYQQQSEDVPVIALLFPLILFIIIFAVMAKSRRSVYSPGKNVSFWTLLWLMSHSNRGSNGSWGNFSSGKGSFGAGRSSMGGGFGGFGGGRFGGGGASGSW
jgi:uncharacterized protein